jgi:perosamine synthetase
MPMLLKKKRQLYNNYKATFRECNFGYIFNPDSFGLSNCWLNAFILNDDVSDTKNDILDFLNSLNISVRPFWKPLHTLDIYKDCPAENCSGAESIYKKVICLPSSANLVQDA